MVSFSIANATAGMIRYADHVAWLSSLAACCAFGHSQRGKVEVVIGHIATVPRHGRWWSKVGQGGVQLVLCTRSKAPVYHVDHGLRWRRFWDAPAPVVVSSRCYWGCTGGQHIPVLSLFWLQYQERYIGYLSFLCFRFSTFSFPRIEGYRRFSMVMKGFCTGRGLQNGRSVNSWLVPAPRYTWLRRFE